MRRRARSSPPRPIRIADLLRATPESSHAALALAGAAGALEASGFPLDDPETIAASRAPAGKRGRAGHPSLAGVLRSCGRPACLDAATVLRAPSRPAGWKKLLRDSGPQRRVQEALVAAWLAAPDPRWMLEVLAYADRTEAVRVACQVARTALPYVPAFEDRPLRAIATAEAWTRGEAPIADVHRAAAAAYAAYAAAVAAAAAAAYAAYAAAYVAYAAAADAYAVADAAADAAVTGRRSGPAFDAALARLADVVRELVPYPPQVVR